MKIAIYYNNGEVEKRDALAFFFRGEANHENVETKYFNAEGFVYRDNGRYYYEAWDSTLCLGNYLGVLNFVENMRALGFSCEFVQ